MAKKVLLLTNEYTSWHYACRYTYEGNFGIEEGLTANGLEATTLPIFHCNEGDIWERWQKHVISALENESFDQVWFEIGHANYTEYFKNWILHCAPIRIGYQVESFTPDPYEFIQNREGTEKRLKRAEQNRELATHIIAVDEKDVRTLNRDEHIPAFWWCGLSIPARFIRDVPLPHTSDNPYFFGTLYGDREKWLRHEELKKLIRLGKSKEDQTQFPAKYNQLIDFIRVSLADEVVLDRTAVFKLVEGIKKIRVSSYPIWLQSLSRGCAVINLPQFAHAYASRVKQGMAVGRPVISFKIPDRPMTEKLFVDGRDILHFSKDSPEELAKQIRKIQSDPEFSYWIAANGLSRLRTYHTTEKFVENVLRWIETGQEPDYGLQATVTSSDSIHPQIHSNDWEKLKQRNLLRRNQPIRLHLGCGEEYLDGYINIDYPPEGHNVMDVKADYYADVTRLDFPDDSVDEIRLHHVFEHFPRVTALAMLIRWQQWLKVGGQIYIETPDIEGCAKTFLTTDKWTVKTGIIRHLTGDQTAFWGYHIEQWFPERFERTLSKLGFGEIRTKSMMWGQEPYLSNVHVIARKMKDIPVDELLKQADQILWESTVSPAEESSYSVWRRQLRKIVAQGGSVATPFFHNGQYILESPDQDSDVTEDEILNIGIKYYGHDSAIFSIDPENQEQFGLATERVTRYKHDTLFPIPAIERFIEYKNIQPEKIKRIRLGSCFLCQGKEKLPINVYEQNRLEREMFDAPYVKDFERKLIEYHQMPLEEKLALLNTPIGKKYQLITDDQRLITLDDHYRRHLRQLFPNAEIELQHFDHEYCHAVSAYYSSPFETALVFAFDGYGDNGYFSRVYKVDKGNFEEIGFARSDVRTLVFRSGTGQMEHECSIGGLYSYFTQVLGFRPDSDEGKVEALAAYGQWNNEVYDKLSTMARVEADGTITIDTQRLEQELSLDVMTHYLSVMKKEDMAAAIQKFLEDILLAYVGHYVGKTGLRKICLSGGVAANVIANLRIFDSLVDEMFIVPAMADDGAAQGAAILTLLEHGYTYESLKWLKAQEMPYWGTSYSKDEVAGAINEFADEIKAAECESDWPEQVAELIIKGEVGAIYQGRMEWGPRALGNRSIVADVRNPEIQNIINKSIKNRPWFQPFCPSILDEERDRLFEKAYTNKHMTTAFVMKPEYRDVLPGAIHVDGTARAQFVTKDDNPNYYRLIKKVKELTGYGIILNTSFNKHGRTIVESPQDALRDFLDTGMDFLVIEGFICRARKNVQAKTGKAAVLKAEVES